MSIWTVFGCQRCWCGSGRAFRDVCNHLLMTIQGLKEKDSQFVTWLLIPVGLRVVALQNEATSLYIGMNSEGRIYTSVIFVFIKVLCFWLINYKNIIFKDLFTNECRFKESVFENYWCLYSSIQYKHPETKVRIYWQKLYFSVQMLKII